MNRIIDGSKNIKRKIVLTGIVFSSLVTAFLFFSSPATSVDYDAISQFSPLSEQNMSVVTREENTIFFLQPDGQVGIGYRCGTLPPTAEQEAAVQERIDELMNAGRAAGISCTVYIPVAFHIVRYDNGVTGNVTDQQINDQMDVLNDAYVSTNFQFVLHSIERINNTAWSQQNSDTDESAMKQALAINPATTLNVYTGDISGGLLGWAYFPEDFPEDSFMHGVVLLYSSLPGGSASPYNEGDTGTHEVGHYLGLYHTFENGCSAPGDHIDDTPYEQSAASGCPTGRDTCPAPGLDPIENFMDYSDDACMNHFTSDQGVRMGNMVELYKPSLISCTSSDFLYVDPDGSCGGNTPCYTTVQTAVNAASTGTSIKILQGSYSENVSLSTSKELTLSGGWNTSYTTQSSTTSVNSLTISNGGITVDNLVLETVSAQMPPTVTTGSATSVTSSSASLNGTVNPNGSSTTYYFQYGTSTSYGSTTTSTSAESGTSDVSVDASISGLSSNTTYHYRLVATNSAGTNYGSDGTFSTSASPITAPTVTTSSATSVSTSSATLNGTFNPNGASTTYYFQYGTTTYYGSFTSSTSAGSGSSSVSASASLTGLSSSTTYHFRLVATNSAGASYGDDQSFTTAISPEQTANVVFYNNLVCAGSSFTADLMIDGQVLTSTTEVYSNCEEFDCGVKLPWTLYATTPSCGIIIIANSIVFDCNCLYKFELDLYEGSSYVYIYETCPGDCSDVSSASIGSTKLLDSVVLTKGANLLGLTVLDPLMSE